MLILTLTNSIGYSGRLLRDEAAFSVYLHYLIIHRNGYALNL